MSGFDSLSRKIRNFLRSKYIRYIIFLLIAFFLFDLFIRGCSDSSISTVYTIGRSARLNINNIMDKDRNILAFSDDLFAEIAQKKGVRFRLFSFSQNELLSLLKSNQIDAILSNYRPDIQDEKNFLFSEPYLLFGPVLIVAKDSEVDTWEEIKYKIIGIPSQSASILEMAKDSTIQMRLYENGLKALSDLNDRRIDGVILPAIPAYVYTRTFYPTRLRIATTPLTTEGLRVITLKTEKGENLIKKFNEGLKEFKESGAYDQLINKWGLVNPEKVD